MSTVPTDRDSPAVERATDVTIEPARPDDAEAIVDVLRRTWLATYPNADAGVTVDDVRRRTDGDDGDHALGSVAEWRELAVPTASRAVYVAREDDRVTGVTSAEVGTHRDGNYRHWVVTLFVLPTAQGRGVGDRLLRANLAWHTAVGPTASVYLNVVWYNHDAIGFYERRGFRRTGHVTDDLTAQRRGLVELPRLELVRPAEEVP